MLAIIKGGTSAEREVSLVTASSVAGSLRRLGIQFIEIDAKDNDWLSQIVSNNVKAVFIALHGPFGEDGQIQRVLEQHGIQYTGSNSAVSEISINKELAKQKVSKSLDVKVPPVYSQDAVTFPVVVKPNKQGSSFGVSIINRAEELPKAIELASTYDEHSKYLIEKLIVGRELTCAVIDIFGQVQPLPLVEIIPTRSFFDYDSKYNSESGCLEICPAAIPTEIAQDIKKKSEQIYKLLKIKQYCRIDWILQGNIPYFIEINTLPGMTPTSLINKELAAQNISFDSFIKQLVETV